MIFAVGFAFNIKFPLALLIVLAKKVDFIKGLIVKKVASLNQDDSMQKKFKVSGLHQVYLYA